MTKKLPILALLALLAPPAQAQQDSTRFIVRRTASACSRLT
jgi:hypothetical protein